MHALLREVHQAVDQQVQLGHLRWLRGVLTTASTTILSAVATLATAPATSATFATATGTVRHNMRYVDQAVGR